MRQYIIVIGLCLLSSLTHSQSAKKYFELGLLAFDEGKLDTAETLLIKSLNINKSSYIAWYYKGVINLLQKQYHQAAIDFNESCMLQPQYSKTLTYRGLARQKTTDYSGALSDFSKAIAINPAEAEAYSFRASLYEMLSKDSLACRDFKIADSLGDDWAQHKWQNCMDRSSYDTDFPILRLEEHTKESDYGFSPDKPIKVGIGPDGGPANQRAYLELLRDPKGNPVSYRRLGSCCNFETINGINGFGLLDIFEITYFSEKGKKITKTIYLSFYEYEEPKILLGLETVHPF